MAKESPGGLLGALDLLVLRTLETCGRMHGYGITLHIQTRSENMLRVEEGSLYPALHRMEQTGLIKAEWGASDNNRRARFYSITTAGRRQLAADRNQWLAMSGAVAKFLKYA